MIPSLPEEAIQRDVSRHIGENLSNYFFLSKYKLIFLRFKFTSIEVTIEVCPCKMLNNIIEYVRTKRPVINPNKGFMKQLLLVAMKYQEDIDKEVQKQEKNARFAIY